MIQVHDENIVHSVLHKIFKRLIVRGLIISLLFLLLVVTTDSCATDYKHRKIKSIPCPCETRNKR